MLYVSKPLRATYLRQSNSVCRAVCRSPTIAIVLCSLIITVSLTLTFHYWNSSKPSAEQWFLANLRFHRISIWNELKNSNVQIIRLVVYDPDDDVINTWLLRTSFFIVNDFEFINALQEHPAFPSNFEKIADTTLRPVDLLKRLNEDTDAIVKTLANVVNLMVGKASLVIQEYGQSTPQHHRNQSKGTETQCREEPVHFETEASTYACRVNFSKLFNAINRCTVLSVQTIPVNVNSTLNESATTASITRQSYVSVHVTEKPQNPISSPRVTANANEGFKNENRSEKNETVRLPTEFHLGTVTTTYEGSDDNQVVASTGSEIGNTSKVNQKANTPEKMGFFRRVFESIRRFFKRFFK